MPTQVSQLREPGLGPVVGHVTPRSARIWIRAGDPSDEGSQLASHRRTIGVMAILRENGRKVRRPRVHYFRLHREFDRTGTFLLGTETGLEEAWRDPEEREPSPPLEPETEYEVKVATLTVDDPVPDRESMPDRELADRLPASRVWRDDLEDMDEETCTARFRTFPEREPGETGPLSFIVGSCRYPGLLWKVKESDRIFGPLRREALGEASEEDGEKRGPVSFQLMVGDQIYADMLNRHVPLALADSFEEFQSRYVEAFGSPNMRRLLRRVPTYMILDDHEIEDNWRQDRVLVAEKRRLFHIAIGAYMSYQWSHGPRTFGRKLFYQFECEGYPFFVLDTRTQRYIEDVADDLSDNHLLGRPSHDEREPSQLDLLLRWLRHQQEARENAPKFIVSPSVFAPNPMTAREGQRERDQARRARRMQGSDSWPAFPATRRAILQAIANEERPIRNVVFLSGDIHCSNVAEMWFEKGDRRLDVRAFSITSSAFYWPFPFADGDPSAYVHDSTNAEQQDTFEVGDGVTMDYKAWNFAQEDNYCRVDVDRENATITVRPFDREGKVMRKASWLDWRSWFGEDSAPELVATLQLDRW